MKVVVTGITGFIGRNFAKTMDDGNDYIDLVREESKVDFLKGLENVRIMRINFTYDELLTILKGKDVVIHMIGQMGGYGIPREKFEKVNCDLTRDIVNVCIEAGIKQFIYLSTPGVQGFGKRLCVETDPYAPRNSYEETKVEAEKIIITLFEKSEVRYTIIRPDFVYGPGDYRRINMYKNIRDKKFVLTTSGDSYLHPTYVDDVVQGIRCALENEKSYDEIFNISAMNDITVKEYLQVMADYFGVKLIHINIGYRMSCFLAGIIEKICNVVLKKDGFVSKNKIDFLAVDHSTSSKKAQSLIGYDPQYDFETGFANTMKWCEDNNLL